MILICEAIKMLHVSDALSSVVLGGLVNLSCIISGSVPKLDVQKVRLRQATITVAYLNLR